MAAIFENIPNPELIFGISAPIGVDIPIIVDTLSASLRRYYYNSDTIHLTNIMKELDLPIEIDTENIYKEYKTKIEYANAVCRKLDDRAGLAMLAISAIRQGRFAKTKDLETPVASHAFIIRQLKRPEEVHLLRTVYGKHFVLISAHVSRSQTSDDLTLKIKRRMKGLVNDDVCRSWASELISIDQNERGDKFGQNLADTFAQADVFIDATSPDSAQADLDRFVDLLFGRNTITPTRAEYGMYIAKSAGLRSSDLSRQVGAAIVRDTGEIISLGSNEVPKAGGGTYWTGDRGDTRDFVLGHDPNDQMKREVVADLLKRMFDADMLNKDVVDGSDIGQLTDRITSKDVSPNISESRIMDIIEFGRIIHAEMCAITDAARLGVGIKGATMYCTTFPCHMCAKHIVSSGLSKLVYIEPYAKSYAAELHGDAIALENSDERYVSFLPFRGVSPFRYRDFFEKGKRKYSNGLAKPFIDDKPRPRVDAIYQTYIDLEVLAVDYLGKKLNEQTSVDVNEGECANSA
jgi:deoxycytidylate deaminase